MGYEKNTVLLVKSFKGGGTSKVSLWLKPSLLIIL